MKLGDYVKYDNIFWVIIEIKDDIVVCEADFNGKSYYVTFTFKINELEESNIIYEIKKD